MATTLSTDFHRSNYSSLPTIDVDIIDEDTIHCRHCGGELVNAAARGHFADYQHRRSAAYDHRAEVNPRCYYCRAEGTVTHTQHAWHDSTDCSRCGGSVGYAIGD